MIKSSELAYNDYNSNFKMESSDESIEVVKDRYGYRMKPCSICGRKFGKRWANHWKVNHPGRVKTELKDG